MMRIIFEYHHKHQGHNKVDTVQEYKTREKKKIQARECTSSGFYLAWEEENLVTDLVPSEMACFIRSNQPTRVNADS